MLRAREVAKDLFKKRSEEKRKSLISNDAKLIVLGANCQGFSPSLLLYSEGSGYMFNCSEGMQRYCYSNRIKLMDLSRVFVTRVVWERISGFYGTALTIQDIGMPSLTIHSNESTRNFMKVTESFIKLHTGMQVINRPYTEGIYKDDYITIESIPLDETESSGDSSESQAKIIAYFCELPDLPGTLDPVKCRQLKVPVGPALGKLKSGSDITLADGTLVRSADVTGPRYEGPRILVIECPTLSDIENLLSNDRLETLRQMRKTNGDREIQMMAHFSPVEVTENDRYRDWMLSFPQDCKHLLLSDSNLDTTLNFLASYQAQYLLRKLDSEIFPHLPLPKSFEERILIEEANPKPYDERPEEDDTNYDQKLLTRYQDYSELDRISKAYSLDRISLRPNKAVSCITSELKISDMYQEAKLMPEFEQQLAALKKLQAKLPDPKPYEPEVVFLGTGSAVPSKYRNTTGILINFTEPKTYSVMLDCGEDTYGQLYRHFGSERTPEILSQLKMIYISHHHADHHIGMIRLLRERIKYTQEQVALVMPPGVDSVLEYHNKNFDDLEGTYRKFSSRSLKTSSSTMDKLKNDEEKDLLRFMDGLLEGIKLVAVEHCVHSCAVVLKFKLSHPEMSYFTLAYSGDARPCEDFAVEGNGCDLLIHEATFDDRSQEDAILKKHCTSAEAIEVGRNMNAKFTILTHFSQKLQKIPYFNQHFHSKIGFAFDHLRIKCPSQLGRLPILKEILTTVFYKHLVDVDMRHLRAQEKAEMLKRLKQE